MIGLDTNVLVRLFVQDDQRHSTVALRFLRIETSPNDPAFVNHIVVCEFTWVLERVYAYSRKQIAAAIEGLLRVSRITVQDSELVASALKLFQTTNADFADILLARVNQSRACMWTATFDRNAAKLPNFHLIA